jgi:hypothetical protein
MNQKKGKELTWPQPTKPSPTDQPTSTQPRYRSAGVVVFNLELRSSSVERCLTPDPPPSSPTDLMNAAAPEDYKKPDATAGETLDSFLSLLACFNGIHWKP